jgi:hypothetical protein
MSKLGAIAGCLFVLVAAQPAAADNLLTNGVLSVAPGTLDFGSVAAGATATNTFLVENMGRAKVVGAVTVPAPFKILSGADYTLRAKEAQVITITYTPSGAEADTETAKFTGGGGAEATVTGKLAAPAPKKSKPRYRAGPVQD